MYFIYYSVMRCLACHRCCQLCEAYRIPLTACHLQLHCGQLEFHMSATQNFCFLKRFQDKQVAVNAVRNFVWCINCFKQDYLSTSGQRQAPEKHEQEEAAGDLPAIVSAPGYALSINRLSLRLSVRLADLCIFEILPKNVWSTKTEN